MNAARSIACVALAALVAMPVPQVLKAQSGLSAADVTVRHAELPGFRLWYRDTGGEGNPVVLLDPATGSVESRVDQFDALRTPFDRCGGASADRLIRGISQHDDRVGRCGRGVRRGRYGDSSGFFLVATAEPSAKNLGEL
jgi:hypothetical protein